MESTYPPSWHGLANPWTRRELILYLEELAEPDPRPIWAGERARGLISDVDQVIHFFFDDHDFDNEDLGSCFLDEDEVELVQSVKRAMDPIIAKLPRGGDDEYVGHPLWAEVTKAARLAHEVLSRR